MNTATDIQNGALNLLQNCVDIKTGDRVLLVEEPPDAHFYCPRLGNILAEQTAELGADVLRINGELMTTPLAFPLPVIEQINRADHAIFLHRIGDYSRFLPLPGSSSKTICYALDQEMLGSLFARLPHRLMSQLLARLENELLAAQNWRITCALGTDIRGTFCWPSLTGGKNDDFTLQLFPVATFKPVPCNTARGTVNISRWLLPGAAPKVEPAVLVFDDVLNIEVIDGMIGAIDGPAASVQAVQKHYDTVAQTLNVCRDRVHSWHAGINPQTFLPVPTEHDLERWGAVSFASPRYLHFHTCGDTPPGEIAWSVFNPTVWIDDEIYWQNGQFVWLQRPDNRALIQNYPGAECLFEKSAAIGI